MKIYICFFIFLIFFVSCGKNDVKLDEEDSVKILADYMKENIEEGSSVKNIIFFADDNSDYTIQSMWIYYESPTGENKTLKLAVSEKENSIIDSIADGKTSLVYDSICFRRENNLIFKFVDLSHAKGRNLKDYDWKNVSDIFDKELIYSSSISQVTLDKNITYVINFSDREEQDNHYVGFRTVSSPNGIDPYDRYNNNYNFKYSCYVYSPVQKGKVYLHDYITLIEPEKFRYR